MFIYLFVCLKCYRISLLYDHDFIALASQPAIDHSLPLSSRYYPLLKTAKALESLLPLTNVMQNDNANSTIY